MSELSDKAFHTAIDKALEWGGLCKSAPFFSSALVMGCGRHNHLLVSNDRAVELAAAAGGGGADGSAAVK